MTSHFKTQLINACKEVLDSKIQFLKNTLQEVTDAGNNETKSTAGDKHETGRAMMQLEQEKLGKQLIALETQKNDFDKIDFSIRQLTVSNGSLIETNQGFFLLASAIGKLEIDGKTIFVISNKSPLGLHLLGLKANSKTTFNGINYEINSLF